MVGGSKRSASRAWSSCVAASAPRRRSREFEEPGSRAARSPTRWRLRLAQSSSGGACACAASASPVLAASRSSSLAPRWSRRAWTLKRPSFRSRPRAGRRQVRAGRVSSKGHGLFAVAACSRWGRAQVTGTGHVRAPHESRIESARARRPACTRERSDRVGARMDASAQAVCAALPAHRRLSPTTCST
jgi:hypothetical protein